MKQRRTASGGIRIIAGRYRRLRIAFDEAPGLRPTPDRVKETIFSWLAPVLKGARCLDAFAGSGALGFEAASRGAAVVDMLELQPRVADRLRRESRRLKAEMVNVHCADASGWLARNPARGEAYTVIFLDPPFRSGMSNRCLGAVAEHGWLAPDGYVYMELGIDSDPLELPAGWELVRAKRAGRVRYHLASPAGRPYTGR